MQNGAGKNSSDFKEESIKKLSEAVLQLNKSLINLFVMPFPKDAQKHMLMAGKEFLCAMQALVEEKLNSMNNKK